MARLGLLMAVALATLAGCHARDSAVSARAPSPQLSVARRGSIEPDATTLQDLSAFPVRPSEYRHLTESECRLLAIRNAPLADDLDAHPANVSSGQLLAHKSSETARYVRGYAADEIRNRSAAEALEEYYKLAVAEAQFDLAAAGRDILQVQLTAAEKANQEGLADRGDINAIRRQILQVEAQAAKLEAGIAALNASLAARLGLDAADPAPLWPAALLRVAPDAIEVEPALATAMHYRPDLNLLRALLSDEKGNSGLANAVLTGVNPLLANQPPTHPIAVLMALLKKDQETHQRQIQSVLASRERQADSEVRAAVALVRGNRGAAAAKGAEVRNLNERVAMLLKREAAGQQVSLELVVARLELLKARGELVQAIADWHISEAKLRQATGMLVRE